ncbi:MAG: glycoside hydrolase family 2 protein [Kiritimatiellia bacterium]
MNMKARLGFGFACVAAAFGLPAVGGAAGPMLTPWGERVNSANCWREYPRPQLVRDHWTCLNGDWEYQVTSVTNTPGRPTEWAGKIRVPFAIESALSGVGRKLEPDEFLWYTRKFECRTEAGKRLLLHFDCVDFRAMVFIGHREVTAVPHESGQLPFAVDVTDFVQAGENELTVCVWDPTGGRDNGDFVNSRGKQALDPAGCFYTRSSGIVGSVWTETVPDAYIAGYRVETDFDRGIARIAFDFAGRRCADGVRVTVDGVGSFAGSDSVEVKLGDGFQSWSVDHPHLYGFTAEFGRDSVKGYFGMRKIEKRRDQRGHLRFFLNNEPIFLLGTLDQGWWPDGLLTPPSDEAMVFDIQTLKDCGYNMMRKHIKIEPLRYYYHCDRMGMILIQDLPSGSGNFLDPVRAQTVCAYGLQRVEMKGMMDLLQPSPAIVMWNPYNEGWSQPGEFLTHAMLDFVRAYDRTRLVNGPSGCWDWEGGVLLPNGWLAPERRVVTSHRPQGVCEAADTVDYHLYRGPYMFPVNDRRISFLGEFGGLGHVVAGHLWNDKSGNWGYGGMKDTATREGLEKVYLGLMEKLSDYAAQGLGGAVYTQTTDVERELNGLLTYDRKVLKFDPAVLRAAHAKVYAAALGR